ncbi:MAG: hypothetical protein COW19_06320 [Zetaproteobacteria bacterium CG12_big_fil_rev_8_21_14_0_65_55_1124]|nr:MAG: hypothetical protein AUJ58_00820 [Zetaproteobacteria bacterium CG1_02_55_237]PIS19683.1 MAG: hypothetical protein COT53_04365 [Zetaproteobacteria bacterium CG08_land_8_20_14_0_20_55_17]PIW42788.1 MAG: hypothetical protein COW19_06320 [Zetaproteobacteria bacterium CG12_big_fil_rev_8_21_14_0_65_55_1124]PIY54008.1 MAG: hypothetical protein COZ01_01855 [Zetaproteobacteria bacterium CG_4_10_14_0_8_um_filter_55_43]PIZ39592.1 MAG: hypothetical protein COY36_02530 [Zetaproteobacteria bacterium 
MRSIIITLCFFFAPIILMFAVRHLTLLLRIWLAWRRARRDGVDIIDITPGKPHPPSRKFIVFAVVVGLICAALVWMRLGDPAQPGGEYVPAHMDAQGQLVPGQHQKP